MSALPNLNGNAADEAASQYQYAQRYGGGYGEDGHGLGPKKLHAARDAKHRPSRQRNGLRYADSGQAKTDRQLQPTRCGNGRRIARHWCGSGCSDEAAALHGSGGFVGRIRMDANDDRGEMLASDSGLDSIDDCLRQRLGPLRDRRRRNADRFRRCGSGSAEKAEGFELGHAPYLSALRLRAASTLSV